MHASGRDRSRKPTAPETWADLYRSFKRYAQCDDGAVAEAWSDFVATLLAEHWGAIRDLNALAKAHPIRKIRLTPHRRDDESRSVKWTIKRSAKDNCPVDARGLCERILRRVELP